MIGGDVADAIAAGLDGVHLDVGQAVEDVGNVAQLGPVELDVLAGGEVAVAAVVLVGDVRKLAQLARVEGAIGHRDAQHVGVELKVEAVHEAERGKFLLGQRPVDAAFDLAAKLRGTLANDCLVKFVVAVHHCSPGTKAGPAKAMVGPERR